MRLSFYSDYSLRLLMYLAVRPDRLVTIQEVAVRYRISKNHLTKVAFDLGRALGAFFAVLDEYTLADLTARNPSLKQLLDPAA